MWTSSDSKVPQAADSIEPSTPSQSERPGAPSRTALSQHSVIGKTIRIKGEISASDPVYIYGSVEGSISAPSHRVTVGKEGKVTADIAAQEVVIMGEVCGNLDGGDRVEIRSEGSLVGNLATHRICIEDGAVVTGSIDIRKPSKKEKAAPPAEPELTLVPAQAASEKESDEDREKWADLAVSEIA